MHINLLCAEQECLAFTLMARQVVRGLDKVLDTGVLPEYYHDVFLKMADHIDEVIESSEADPYTIQTKGRTDFTIWYLSLAAEYASKHDFFEKISSLSDVSETLRYFISQNAEPYGQTVEWMLYMQGFFKAIEDAVNCELSKEFTNIAFNPAIFPEASTRLQ